MPVKNRMPNTYIKRFNRLYREDILDAYMSENMEEVIQLSKEWLKDYNYKYPHKSLRWLSPIKYYEHFPVESTLNRKMDKQKKLI